jgi:hypothetical protein
LLTFFGRKCKPKSFDPSRILFKTEYDTTEILMERNYIGAFFKENKPAISR